MTSKPLSEEEKDAIVDFALYHHNRGLPKRVIKDMWKLRSNGDKCSRMGCGHLRLNHWDEVSHDCTVKPCRCKAFKEATL